MLGKACAVLVLLTIASIEARERRSRAYITRDLGACSVTQFQCKNGVCINSLWKCDTENDCLDDTDEVNCPTDCSGPNQFQCSKGRCIPRTYLCDKYDDCGDGSDERNCSLLECKDAIHNCRTYGVSTCDTYKEWAKINCNATCGVCPGPLVLKECADYANCSTYGKSICTNSNYRVWAEDNCSKFCGYCGLGCLGKDFPCKSGSCISEKNLCDTDYNCPDRDDETGCPTDCSHPNQYRCQNGKCIAASRQCNGIDECDDNSDELQCDPKNVYQNSHIMFQLPRNL